MESTASERCPCSSNRCGIAVGMWRGEPFAVGVRHHPVVASLPDVDRDADRRERRSPTAGSIAMSSSNQPQYDSRSASRKLAAAKSANAPVSDAAIDVVDEVAERCGHLVARDLAEDRPVPFLERDRAPLDPRVPR